MRLTHAEDQGIEDTLRSYGFYPGDVGYEQAHAAYMAALIGKPRSVRGMLIDEWLDFIDELPTTGCESPFD